MKKNLVLALLAALAVGSATKAVFANGGGGGGFVTVMVTIIDADNKHSKAESKDISKLGAEFAALNGSTEGTALMQQSAGSSETLKVILN